MSEKTTFGLNARDILTMAVTFVAMFMFFNYTDSIKGVDPTQSSTQSSINVINNSMAMMKMDLEEIKEHQKKLSTKEDLEQVKLTLDKHGKEIDEIKSSRFTREDHKSYAIRMDREHQQIISSIERLVIKIDRLHQNK